MAKTGGAVQKLADKTKRNGVRFKMGTFKPLLGRTHSTFAEKALAMEQHRRAIHGHVVVRDGVEIRLSEGGLNPGPADTFKGDGLPDDSLAAFKAPKTMQERADEDKRQPLKHEMVEGWRPRPFGKRARSGSYLAR